MAEPIEDGIFREIEEELRHEQFNKLWERYGRILITVAVVIVACVAGYKGWEGYDQSQRGKDGERFAASLRLGADGNAEAALDALKTLGNDAGTGYAMLSRFQSAALMAKNGNAKSAMDTYDALAQNSSLDSIYRDLAQLLGTIQGMNSGVDAAVLKTRLGDLTLDSNPWRYSARELLAVITAQSGDKSAALELFKALSEEAGTPQGIRQRAAEMISALSE